MLILDLVFLKICNYFWCAPSNKLWKQPRESRWPAAPMGWASHDKWEVTLAREKPLIWQRIYWNYGVDLISTHPSPDSVLAIILFVTIAWWWLQLTFLKQKCQYTGEHNQGGKALVMTLMKDSGVCTSKSLGWLCFPWGNEGMVIAAQ